MDENKVDQWEKVLLKLVVLFIEEISKVNHHEMINFCLEKNKRNEAEEFLKNVKKTNLKDSAFALKKKEEGNEKFKIKQYEESLLLYTESIFHATKDDEVLPLSYSNRSLVLEHLDYFSESVRDIDLALECGYPKQKVQNLIIRKARCLVKMGENEKAREILTEALKSIKKKEYHKVIKNELKNLKNSKHSVSSQHSEFKLPELSGGENENFPFASKHLSVQYDERRGRHVIANQDISMGEVLFVEKPFAHSTLTKICCTCFKSTKAPIPCWSCTGAYYCSPKCRDDAWNSFHPFECGFAEFLKSLGIACLGLRVVLSASSSFEELKKILNNISEPVYKNNSIIQISKGYEAIYNLVHHTQNYRKIDLFQYAMTALLLALYLKNYTNYFPAESDEEDLNLLSTVMLRHVLQLNCNGFCIFNPSNEIFKSNMFSQVGTGIYSSISMMNHSCKSSVHISFYQNYAIIRALKFIGKSGEVFHDYGPDATRMKRAKRQEILREQYFFKCECIECLRRFDNYDILTAFKCDKCNGPSIKSEENSRKTFCVRCYHKSEISPDTEKKYNIFYSLMRQGELNSDVVLSLSKYLQAWRIGREIFYRFNVDLAEAASEVASNLLHLGSLRRCILFLKCCVRSVEERFGLFSFETAVEMKKLGDVILSFTKNNVNAKDVKDLSFEGMHYYMKVQYILTCFPEFKSESEIFKNLEINMQILSKNL